MQSEENYIPEEGYLFFPTSKYLKPKITFSEDEIWNTNGMRWMFDGPMVLEEHEK